MKYYYASQIHNGKSFEQEPKVLVFNEENVFVECLPKAAVDADLVQHFEGILLPGFVNAHCHLELSHTQNLIPEHTGLVDFLSQVVSSRFTVNEQKHQLIAKAFDNLAKTGCVAVGDIANDIDTLQHRSTADFHIHTFVETMGFVPEGAVQRFDYAKKVFDQFASNTQNENAYKLSQSITAHAPYSVSDKLFGLIDKKEPKTILSIHNQECQAENEYFISKHGDMKRLYERLKIDDTWFVATGKNSLPSYLPYINTEHDLILVHNIFTQKEDAEILKQRKGKTSFCFCPNANLYIENTLPDVEMLAASGINMCIGTDSLASNHQLNIYSEVQTLDRHFPAIGLEKLLSWATLGGAIALNLEQTIGSFAPGLKPGLVLIEHEKAQRIL